MHCHFVVKRRIESDNEHIYDDVEVTTSVYETTPWTTAPPSTSSTEAATVSPDVPNPTPTYEDDFETVDDHKTHDPTHGIPSTNSPSLPDICKGHFDAVATLRDELFIFKDQVK